MLDDIIPSQLVAQIGVAQDTPFAIKDLNHRFVYANPSFCQLLGTSAEALIGKNDLEIGRPRELVLGNPLSGWPGLWALDDQVVKQKTISRTADLTSAEQGNLETVRVPLRNADGEVTALLVQLFDVSEVRELKQRIANNVDVLSLREGEISTMESVLASLMACQDTGTLLEQLAGILVARTRADCCYAATLHESGEFMEIVAANGNHSAQYFGGQFRRGEGTIGRVWDRGASIYFKDVSVIQSIHQWPAGTQAFSLPLFVEGEAIAALTVISDTDSKDLADNVPLLERICGMASMAIANTRLIDVTQQRLRVTRALAEVSQALTTLDNVEEAYNLVCRILLPAMDAKRASILQLDESGELTPQVSWGYSHGSLTRPMVLTKELACQSIAQWCVDNDSLATIGRVEEDAREASVVHALRAENNVGSTCCIPLKHHEGVFGAMILARSRDMREFSEAHIDMFQAVVNQLSTSINRIELAAKLKHQAFHDRLTGLPNRYQLESILGEAIDEANNCQGNFYVMFVDLDGFKEVNDFNGHATGDRLLSSVAERLSSVIGERDTLVRMGGDEFAVIVRIMHMENHLPGPC